MNTRIQTLLVLLVSLLLPVLNTAWAAAIDTRLGWVKTPDGADIQWVSSSLTPAAPYIHYEYQAYHSLDLEQWEPAGGVVPGGFLGEESVMYTIPLAATNAQGFVRLSYRLNMPGANLAGLDLSGADLRGANLAGANLDGANLDGAWLGGADLTGATLADASLAGANLQDVVLDGLDLAAVDLSGIEGTPRLGRLNAPAEGAVSALLPRIPYRPDPRDFVVNEPGRPGVVSRANAMVMLQPNATVGELNDLLDRHGAVLVGCAPGDAALTNGTMMVRLSTSSVAEMDGATQALRQEPIVAAAAPDIVLGLNTVPNDEGGATVGLTKWRWNNGLFGATGGNWGWEKARVPQMWNLNSAVNKRMAVQRPTCVIDNIFSVHDDLLHWNVFNAGRGGARKSLDHGNHVSGIVGAIYDNDEGMDGVNPFAILSGFEHEFQSDPNIAWPASDSRYASIGYGIIQDLRGVLTNLPNVAVVNVSLGYNWKANGGITNSPTAAELAWMDTIASQYGVSAALVAGSVLNQTLFVTTAGNDSAWVPAHLNNPLTYAALVGGLDNVIVVESHGKSGARSSFSNVGGHVAAPGEDIMSAGYTNGTYVVESGTSMAAPFVAGLAGYLLAVDPALEPADLIDLIRRNGPNVDAFTSVMEIDSLAGRNKEVLRLLLDIDDGTFDGSTRLHVPASDPARDRAFEWVHSGAADINDAQGDGIINMGDFRRWRDWFLFGDGGHALNGAEDHAKNDANGDGRVDRSDEANLFPRGDFNGNGKSQRSERTPVPGVLQDQNLTDLEVLMLSGLWADLEYFASELPDLIDSIDLWVSVANFYAKNTDDAVGDVEVQIHDAKTGAPLSNRGPVDMGAGDPVHLFTIPTGGKYYAASLPVDVGNGTNIMMRSIGDFNTRQGDRGGDFAVDLALIEMTAVGETKNPELREIDSQPDAEEVDAHLDALGGWTEGKSTGARAWSNQEGTLYAVANAGWTEVPPPDSNEGTTFTAGVKWQRSFVKDAKIKDPTFEVKPMELMLAGLGPEGTDLDALAEIVIEMRAFGTSPDWQILFTNRARIAGHMEIGNQPATFEVVEMGLLPAERLVIGNYDMEYVQEKYKGTIDLSGVPDGHTFEVRYRLLAEVIGNGADNLAYAYVGDPLDYGSGVRMEYGSFGELPRVASYHEDDQGRGRVGFYSHTNYYYILLSGTNSPVAGLPLELKLGAEGLDEFTDPLPAPGAGEDTYTIENRPLDQPWDHDGDQIDDVFELMHPDFLDPLNPADALLDFDGDGRTNLREYLDGTDPTVADVLPEDLYPARLIEGMGDKTGDVNNDGVMDLIGLVVGSGLEVSLGQPDGTFLTPVQSAVPEAGFSMAYTLALVDADAIVDALVTDRTAHRLQVMLGNGDGTFRAGSQYAAGNRPSRVTTGDVNGDGRVDALLVNDSGWMVTVLLGNGDGTFQAPVDTETQWTPYDVTVGHLDADTIPDLAVALANHTVAILPGNGDGTFKPRREFATGFTPRRVGLLDINLDGNIDFIWTLNQIGDSVSLLPVNGDGTLGPRTDYLTGDNPRELELGDVDLDGDLDMVIGHFGAAYHTVLLQGPAGEFTVDDPAYTHNGGTCLLADIDRDGRLDLLTGVNGQVFLSPGLPGGRFETRLDVVIPRLSPVGFDLADINGDGVLDALIGNRQSNSVEIVTGSGGGALAWSGTVPIASQVAGLVAAQLSDDNAVDFAVVTERPMFSPGTSSNELHVVLGDGAGGFTTDIVIPLTDAPRDVVAGDLNGDGRNDLVVLLAQAGQAATFLREAGGGWTAGTPLDLGGSSYTIEVRDLNGDGRADLTAATSVGAATILRMFTADAVGNLVLAQELTPADGGSVGDFTIQDVTGDGRADLVASVWSVGGSRLDYYEAALGGEFGAEVRLLEDFNGSDFEMADVSGDGVFDLVSGGTIWVGRADGGFENPQSYWIGSGLPVRVVDVSGDGLPDLVGADDFSDSLRVLNHR